VARDCTNKQVVSCRNEARDVQAGKGEFRGREETGPPPSPPSPTITTITAEEKQLLHQSLDLGTCFGSSTILMEQEAVVAVAATRGT